MERMVLHAGADAAGEVLLHVLIFLLHAAANGDHVRRGAVTRIDRREGVVEESTLLEVRIERIGAEREQPARQLEHVVDVARLAGAAVDAMAQLIWRSEVLGQPMSTRRVAVMLRDAVPEERRGENVFGIADVAIASRRSDELRDLAVAMLAVEVVLMPLE